MARSIWKGSISFGLAGIPVALYPGKQGKELHLTLLDQRDMSPVGYKRVNKATGDEVAREQIVKGDGYDKDRYVVLGEEEFRNRFVRGRARCSPLGFQR